MRLRERISGSFSQSLLKLVSPFWMRFVSLKIMRASPEDVVSESNTKIFLFVSAVTVSAARRAELYVPLSFELRVSTNILSVVAERIVSAKVSTDGQAVFGACLCSFILAVRVLTSLSSVSW